jgi:hypothetical protein
MSVTAVGVALDLDGPLPVPRRFSLLATPGIVVEEVGPEGGDPRWMAGVNVIGYPNGLPNSWEPCATGTTRVKSDGGDQPQKRFDPIAVYLPLTCSSHGLRDPQKLADRVELALDATLSFGVERALARGVALSTNGSLGDGNMIALASGAAVSPSVGLGYLENAIGDRTGRQGVIHSTPAVVAAWGYGDAVNPSNDPVTEGPSALGLRSPNGTPIISGAGYIGAHPTGGLAGPTPTSDWVFATGPVEVRIGRAQPVSIEESIDTRINDIVVRAERYVLYDWDGALQVGVLIDWSL